MLLYSNAVVGAGVARVADYEHRCSKGRILTFARTESWYPQVLKDLSDRHDGQRCQLLLLLIPSHLYHDSPLDVEGMQSWLSSCMSPLSSVSRFKSQRTHLLPKAMYIAAAGIQSAWSVCKDCVHFATQSLCH